MIFRKKNNIVKLLVISLMYVVSGITLQAGLYDNMKTNTTYQPFGGADKTFSNRDILNSYKPKKNTYYQPYSIPSFIDGNNYRAINLTEQERKYDAKEKPVHFNEFNINTNKGNYGINNLNTTANIMLSVEMMKNNTKYTINSPLSDPPLFNDPPESDDPNDGENPMVGGQYVPLSDAYGFLLACSALYFLFIFYRKRLT